MRDDQLFAEIGRRFDLEVYQAELESLREVDSALRRRTAQLFDRVFEQLGQPLETEEEQTQDMTVGECVWRGHREITILFPEIDTTHEARRHWGSGEIKTTTPSEETPERELTSRWVILEIPADDKYQVFTPEGSIVKKRLMIGTHDLRFWNKNKEDWGPQSDAVSLDALTTFFIEPRDKVNETDGESQDVIDPFEEARMVVLERLNEKQPVFDDESKTLALGFVALPAPQPYTSKLELIAGINSTIDEVENALNFPDLQSGRFSMNTETLPEGVDPELAAQRTRIIESWRTKQINTETAFRNLLDLFWQSEKHEANVPTRTYLQQSAYQFPVEADLPNYVASKIFQDAMAVADES